MLDLGTLSSVLLAPINKGYVFQPAPHTLTHSVIFLSTCTSLLCWLILLIIIITLVAGTFQIFCAHNFTLLVNRFSKCFQSLLQFYEAQCGALPGNECNS